MADPEPTMDEALAAVGVASKDLDAARVALHQSVRDARSAGATYAAIANILGVTRQAAWERFGKKGDHDLS